MKAGGWTVAVAFFVLAAVFVTGYTSFGIWPTVIFMVGYVPGAALWLLSPRDAPWSAVKVPYLAAFAIYILHLHRDLARSAVPHEAKDSRGLVLRLDVLRGHGYQRAGALRFPVVDRQRLCIPRWSRHRGVSGACRLVGDVAVVVRPASGGLRQ